MIPQLVTYRQRRRDGRWLRLYVPVVPVLLLLSPLLLVGGLIACLCFRISLTGALRGAGRLFWALPGARFELDDGQTAVRVSVR